MSDKEAKRRKVIKEVMKRAWRIYKHCMNSWSSCLKVSWCAVRNLIRVHYSKVKGTSYGDRQLVLKRLVHYSEIDISLKLIRDMHNPYDKNAIEVKVFVRNNKGYIIGNVSREIAARIAPLIDQGHEVAVIFEGVTGVNREEGMLGVNFSYITI